MRLIFHEEDDSLHIRLDEAEVIESEEVLPGVVVDFNDKEQIVGVEILRAKSQLPHSVLLQLQKRSLEQESEVA